LNILVCVKPVFNAEAEIQVVDGKVTSSEPELVINPFDEYAVEAAVQLKEKYDASITVLTLGTTEQIEAARHALAMGADEAFLAEIENASTLDTRSTARVIAAFIKEDPRFDLIIFGRQTVEFGSGLVPSQVARLTGLPFVGLAGKIDISEKLTVERVLDNTVLTVSAELPTVISVVQSIGEPRFPSFMGIRKAKKAEIPSWKPSNLLMPLTSVSSLSRTNANKDRGECVFISPDDPVKAAGELFDKIMAEKIL